MKNPTRGIWAFGLLLAIAAAGALALVEFSDSQDRHAPVLAAAPPASAAEHARTAPTPAAETASLGTTLSPPPLNADRSAGTEAARAKALQSATGKILMREEFARNQIDVRSIECHEEACHMALQLPPFVDASVRHDNAVAAHLLSALQQEYANQPVQVGLSKLAYAQEGMAIDFDVRSSEGQGRYLSNAEITKIRADTLKAYLESNKK